LSLFDDALNYRKLDFIRLPAEFSFFFPEGMGLFDAARREAALLLVRHREERSGLPAGKKADPTGNAWLCRTGLPPRTRQSVTERPFASERKKINSRLPGKGSRQSAFNAVNLGAAAGNQ
jgi:hypothetical protein